MLNFVFQILATALHSGSHWNRQFNLENNCNMFNIALLDLCWLWSIWFTKVLCFVGLWWGNTFQKSMFFWNPQSFDPKQVCLHGLFCFDREEYCSHCALQFFEVILRKATVLKSFIEAKWSFKYMYSPIIKHFPEIKCRISS